MGNCEALHEITYLVHEMLSVCAPLDDMEHIAKDYDLTKSPFSSMPLRVGSPAPPHPHPQTIQNTLITCNENVCIYYIPSFAAIQMLCFLLCAILHNNCSSPPTTSPSALPFPSVLPLTYSQNRAISNLNL